MRLSPRRPSIHLCPALCKPSTSNQPIEKRPSKHETAQSPNNILHPKPTQLTLKEPCGLSFRKNDHYKAADNQGTDQIENEARIGFEADDAGCDAEEGGCQGPNLGYDLKRCVNIQSDGGSAYGRNSREHCAALIRELWDL